MRKKIENGGGVKNPKPKTKSWEKQGLLFSTEYDYEVLKKEEPCPFKVKKI